MKLSTKTFSLRYCQSPPVQSSAYFSSHSPHWTNFLCLHFSCSAACWPYDTHLLSLPRCRYHSGTNTSHWQPPPVSHSHPTLALVLPNWYLPPTSISQSEGKRSNAHLLWVLLCSKSLVMLTVICSRVWHTQWAQRQGPNHSRHAFSRPSPNKYAQNTKVLSMHYFIFWCQQHFKGGFSILISQVMRLEDSW